MLKLKSGDFLLGLDGCLYKYVNECNFVVHEEG